MRTLLALILVMLLAPRLLAQPAEVSRVLRNFDFEERRLGNPEDTPMHWTKVEGVGLPHYVNGRLSTDRARSGQYSFRLDLNGGSLIYRYDADQILVQPGAHYRVEGFVQTTALPNARARLTAYFVDQDDRPITSTIRHSELFASPADDTSWHKIGLELSFANDAPLDPAQESPVAHSLVIELALLQPVQYAPPSLGQRTLFAQDIHGTAWFDDVTVSQVPKVTMSTDQPGNIFRQGDPLLMKVLVNDRFTDDLEAQLVISDTLGKAVFQRSGALDMSAAQTLGPGQKKMTLALPENLPPGWYESALVMSSRGQFVGKQTLDFVLLADNAAHSVPDPRFGIVATDLPFEGWDDLPQILSILAAGRVKLAIWSGHDDVQQTHAGDFDRLLERLSEMRIEPTACLIALPSSITNQLDRLQAAISPTSLVSHHDAGGADVDSKWIQLLHADPQIWQPQLAYMIARHAKHLERWQLGADGSDSFVTHPQMRLVYNRIYKEFAKLVERPDVAMPWPAWYELDGQLPATVALHVKPEVLPAQIPLYVNDLMGNGSGISQNKAVAVSTNSLPANHNLSIFLEPLAREQYGREVQIRDMAQRIIYALSADAKRIDLKLPFTVTRETAADVDSYESTESQPCIKQPQELLIIIRTVMATLGGAVFKGKVPIADGVEAFLFDRNGEGILALWDRGMTGGDKQLAINLGPRARRIDLWGNVTPLIQHPGQTRSGESSNVRLDIGPTPFFLVDVDGQLAQLRASIAIDNPLLESSFRPHVRKIRFINPYHQAISGTFKLSAPTGWVINPPTTSFSLNPGEVFEKELTIEFPYNSFAGPKTINAEFQVQADNSSTFTAPITLKLGLSDVGLQTLALRDGNNVIVQQMITNYGEKPINYNAYAVFPGQTRVEHLINNLAAGRTIIKKYIFRNVTIMPETKVRSGVKELDGTRMLNDEVPVQ